MVRFDYKKVTFQDPSEEKVWTFVKAWTEKNKKQYNRYVKSQKHKHPEEHKHLNLVDFYLEHTCEA